MKVTVGVDEVDVGKMIGGASALASLIPGVGMLAGPIGSLASSLLGNSAEQEAKKKAEQEAQLNAQKQAESDAISQTDQMVKARQKNLAEALSVSNMNIGAM